MFVKLLFGLMFAGGSGLAIFMTVMELWSRSLDFSHFTTLLSDNAADIIVYLPFFIVGVLCMKTPVKQLFDNMKTKTFGKVSFGYVYDFESANYIVNGHQMYKAKVIIIDENGQPKKFSEEIGAWSKCRKYDKKYITVQHTKNDLNILEVVDSNGVPSILKQYVNSNYPETPVRTENEANNNQNVVIIDGVRYVKKSSIKKEDELDA